MKGILKYCVRVLFVSILCVILTWIVSLFTGKSMTTIMAAFALGLSVANSPGMRKYWYEQVILDDTHHNDNSLGM